MKPGQARAVLGAWATGRPLPPIRRPRVACPVCDRTVAGYVPKRGDGSLWRPYRHKASSGEWCAGRFESAEFAKETPT